MNAQPLFKYRTLNCDDPESLKRVEQIFLHNELYFPPPSELNDPFDCKILPFFQTSEDIFKKHLVERIKADQDFPDAPDNVIEAFADKMVAEGMHENKAEVISAFKSSLEKTLEGVGVCSFSEKSDDILMWSHDANGHTGFCLEFDVLSGNSFFSRAIDVSYEEAYPSLNFYENKKWMQTIILTKSNRWKYEAEWRILKYDGPGVEKFPEASLSSVILGCRMQEKEKNIIRNLVSKRRSKVQIKEARIKEYEFGLEII